MHIFKSTYRPLDSNLNEFPCDLDQVLGKIAKEKKLVFLKGDWNLHLINHHCHKATSDFLDLLYSRMFFPLITRPTRITANKASLTLDNVFLNDPLRPSLSGLFLNDISCSVEYPVVPCLDSRKNHVLYNFMMAD